MRLDRPSAPAECAVCGTTLERSARACPECGADERTGWREQSIYDGIDLPDETAGQPDFAPDKPTLAWYWIGAAILLLLLLGFSALGLR